PAFPRAHVCDVGDPGLVWTLNGKTELQRIRSEQSGDASGISRHAIAMERLDVVDPHNPSDSMLATGFTRFAQIEKDPRGSVHAVACVVGRDDQSKQSLIFPRSIGERISQPRIEPAARHVEETAHHGRIKLMTMGLDEGVLHSNILRSLPHMHGILPWSNAFQMCPLNLGKFRSLF